MKLTVHTAPSYDIFIENGCFAQAGARIRAALPDAKRAVLVTDSHVGPLYAQAVRRSLETAGFSVSIATFPAGEASKSLQTVCSLYHAFSKAGLNRTDIAVALGGGVCGDLTGFAAATWLRGIAFVQLPTSLLAQVDSSVGGKTGVDLPEGKNLIGAFHQPALVLIDPATLSTLPEAYFADGMGEVIKYGCIRDAALFARLGSENCRTYLPEMLRTCVEIKCGIVERDERDTGERAVLNFGHTFGHALELVQHYHGISHGKAVGIGMVLISQIGEAAGITQPGTAAKIISLLQQYNLPTACSESLADLLPATSHDKKSVGNRINLIFLREIGDCLIHSVDRERLSKLCGVQP